MISASPERSIPVPVVAPRDLYTPGADEKNENNLLHRHCRDNCTNVFNVEESVGMKTPCVIRGTV